MYSQLAAEFLGRHIPGNPEIIVQHRPGGGGEKGASFFINKTQPDGMTFGVFPDSLGLIQFTRPKAAKGMQKSFDILVVSPPQMLGLRFEPIKLNRSKKCEVKSLL